MFIRRYDYRHVRQLAAIIAAEKRIRAFLGIVPGGFEPPSMAPKAIMIGHYTTGLDRVGRFRLREIGRPPCISDFRSRSGCRSLASSLHRVTATVGADVILHVVPCFARQADVRELLLRGESRQPLESAQRAHGPTHESGLTLDVLSSMFVHLRRQNSSVGEVLRLYFEIAAGVGLGVETVRAFAVPVDDGVEPLGDGVVDDAL